MSAEWTSETMAVRLSGDIRAWTERGADIVAEKVRECDPQWSVNAQLQLADEIREDVESRKDGVPDPLALDLLTRAIWRVDFMELAKLALGDVELWAVGENIPGYLPDSMPEVHVGLIAAQTALSDMVETFLQDEDAPEDTWLESRQAARNFEYDIDILILNRCFFAHRLEN